MPYVICRLAVLLASRHLYLVRTGLKLSTYFSAIKLRWMIDNYSAVKMAHIEDNLLFGTVESWIAYVGHARSRSGL